MACRVASHQGPLPAFQPCLRSITMRERDQAGYEATITISLCTFLLADVLSLLSMSICSWILLLFSSFNSLTFWTRVCPCFWSSNTPLAPRSWFKSPWRSYRLNDIILSVEITDTIVCCNSLLHWNNVPLHMIEAVHGPATIPREVQRPCNEKIITDQMNYPHCMVYKIIKYIPMVVKSSL